MQNWKLEVSLSVADSWVADGFNAKERLDDIVEQIQSILPFAYGHEVKVKVRLTSGPDPKVVKALQNGDLQGKD